MLKPGGKLLLTRHLDLGQADSRLQFARAAPSTQMGRHGAAGRTMAPRNRR